MSFSKIKAVAVVLTIAAAASAQLNVPENARMRSLGGAPMSDISGVFNYPVLMMGYPDHIQATFSEGGIIATKQIGEAFSLGILANQGLMCPNFADAARARLNSTVTPVAVTGFNNAYNIPHLLIGFGAGPLNIGLDVFLEYSSLNTNTVINDEDNISKARILNPGARASAGLEFGDIGILAKFGMSFPSIYAEFPSGADNEVVKLEQEKALYMETGAEVGMPIADWDFTAGFEYTFENYKLDKGAIGITNWNSLIAIYLGLEFNFLETAAAAVGYTFSRRAGTAVNEYRNASDSKVTDKEMTGSHYHTFNLGMENIWDDAWFFDALALRAGSRYELDVPVARTTSDGDLRFRRKSPGTHTGVVPTMGFGISKSFLTLDLALDMGNWNSGVFAGPSAALVTGTIKY